MHKHTPYSSEAQNVKVVTDKDGRVHLGHMKKVMTLNVNVPLFNITQNFMFNDARQAFTYPSAVDVVENETLEFPVIFKKKKRTNISLIRKGEDTVLDDLFDTLEFVT